VQELGYRLELVFCQGEWFIFLTAFVFAAEKLRLTLLGRRGFHVRVNRPEVEITIQFWTLPKLRLNSITT
jgi:hypothetical protein